MRHWNRLHLLPLVLVLTAPVIAQQDSVSREKHVGRVQDWTMNHIVFGGGLLGADLQTAIEAEPRILFHLAARNLDGMAGTAVRAPQRGKVDGGNQNPPKDVRVDWSVNLGAGVVAQNMYPAKFTFDVGGTPDCTNDYVVFALNAAGANGGQANLVGINRLYSGANPRFCNNANPRVNWAYNGTTVAGGLIRTSPVISLNGTKIAYVESLANRTIFHILTWVAGQGTSATNAVNPTANGACTAATSCLKSLTLSATATDTFSSPWVDYATDKAFVGSDDGKIYRISCVFNCALNSNPTIDWTFTLPVAGTGGALPQPNGPVYNSPYGYLIVGDQLGELWTIKANTGTPTLVAGPIMVGGGGCTVINPPGRTGTPAPCTPALGAYGIPDSIILDARGNSKKILAFSGNDGTVGSAAVVAQLDQTLTNLIRAHVGLGGINIHTGALDNNYWGTTPATGRLFMCGTGPADTTPYHYWIGFTSYPKMNTTPTGSLQRLNAANVQCVPYTEFFNPNINLGGVAGHHDLLMSGLVDATNGYIITNDISTGVITAGLNSVNYPGGISGIIIDNSSTQSQASSLYFSTLGVVNVGTCGNQRCAVKLTQANLQ
ncbi:MAG TPA: hypothetical protein VH437_15545 [Terriglobales bacterium]|jgi:hypothetical protein